MEKEKREKKLTIKTLEVDEVSNKEVVESPPAVPNLQMEKEFAYESPFLHHMKRRSEEWKQQRSMNSSKESVKQPKESVDIDQPKESVDVHQLNESVVVDQSSESVDVDQLSKSVVVEQPSEIVDHPRVSSDQPSEIVDFPRVSSDQAREIVNRLSEDLDLVRKSINQAQIKINQILENVDQITKNMMEYESRVQASSDSGQNDRVDERKTGESNRNFWVNTRKSWDTLR